MNNKLDFSLFQITEFKELEKELDSFIKFSVATGSSTEQTTKLKQIKETIVAMRRQAVRLNAAAITEVVGMLGMMAYNLIDSEGHAHAGLVVYPVMLATAAYMAHLMNSMDKKRLHVHNIIKNASKTPEK